MNFVDINHIIMIKKSNKKTTSLKTHKLVRERIFRNQYNGIQILEINNKTLPTINLENDWLDQLLELKNNNCISLNTNRREKNLVVKWWEN